MALSSAKKLAKLPSDKRIDKVGPAAAGTYLPGELLMCPGDDNYLKPVSASVVVGTQGCGIVTKKQTVATSGDSLEYQVGIFSLSGSGFTQSEIGKIAWCSDSALGLFDAQGTNRQAVGRYFGPVTGDSFGNNGLFEIGNVRSGSAA